MMAAKKRRAPVAAGGAADQNRDDAEQYPADQEKTRSLTFNQARNAFVKRVHEQQKLKTTTVLIALLIAECFNQRRFETSGQLIAFPTDELLAKQARISTRQVRTHTAIVELCRLYDSTKGGDGRAKEYIAVLSDRKSTSGLECKKGVSDRKPSVVRPEAQRRQTGSPLPHTSDTTDTSDGAGGPSARPAGTSVPEFVVVNGAPDSGARSSAPDSALDAPAGAVPASFPSDLEGALASCLQEIEQQLRGGRYSTSDEWWKHVTARANEFERTWPGNQHRIDRWVDQAEALGVFHDFPLDQQEGR